MTTSCPLLSKTPLWAKCCALGKRILGISYLYVGVESVLKADFGPKGWDCAGRRLDIGGELGQQVQRSASATPSRASSICSPQPDQVAFLQSSQTTLEHIGWLLTLKFQIHKSYSIYPRILVGNNLHLRYAKRTCHLSD
jgi:hypothetical protein